MRRRAALAVILLALAAPLAAQFHPNSDRGFAPDKTYSFDGIDNVNLFNGNLIATIPLGQRYHVGAALDYGLVLVYNSNVWDLIVDGATITNVPNRRSNAGIGWQVSLGAILSPTDPQNETIGGLGTWIFESPDGAHHLMYDDGSGASSPLYSRDGTFIKMTSLSTRTWQVEYPDGRIFNFYDYAGDGTDWRLQQIADRTSNTIDFDYTVAAGDADTWTIADSQGRRQVLHFSSATGTTYGGKLLTRVTLTAFGATEYTFAYEPLIVSSGLYDGPQITVDVLKTVTLPGNTASFSAADPNGTLNYDTSGNTSCVMRRLRLPTGGRIEWGYTVISFPSSSAPKKERTRNLAVTDRRLVDSDGATLGTWSYGHYVDADSRCSVPCGAFMCTSGNGRQKTTVVRAPAREGGDTGARDTAMYYYSVYTSASDACPNAEWWTDEEYGIAFTRYAADGAGRFLSSETRTDIPDADFAATNPNWRRKGSIPSEGTIRRSGYVQYEYDPLRVVEDAWNTNRRVKSSSTHFDDDAGCGGAVCTMSSDRSAYDGHGHYGHTVETSNFPSAVPRTTFTNYITDPVSWIWGLSTETCAVDQQTTITDCSLVSGGPVVKTSFDTSNGQLVGRRLLAGSSLGANDLLTFFTYTTNGEIASEKSYGGDAAAQQLDTSTAFPTPPATAQYQLDHSYTYSPAGALTKHTAAYRDPATGQAMTFLSADEDYDASTGVVSAVRDTAGVQTSFVYDARGRLTSSTPAAGALTKYTYSDASFGLPASVTEELRNHADTTTLAQQSHYFDGIGRLARSTRNMPVADPASANIVATTRTRTVNAMGWVTRTSGYEGTPSPQHVTSTAFDAFARPTSVVAPDGTTASIAYTSTRQIDRTVNGITTTETYDDRGRLLQVKEPSGVNGALTTTAYAYDSGNRLRSATTSGSATTQSRLFTYDNRGFLLSERHPEKGATGNGTTYYEYDAGGHVTHRFEGSSGGPLDLVYLYDAAGRLTTVQDFAADGTRRAVKELSFATANAAGDLRRGKLLSATRHNYDTILGSDLTVTQTYAYGDAAGRLTGRTTSVGTTASYTSSPTFITAQTWTDLGPATLRYPALCTTSTCPSSAPTRELSYGYDATNAQLLKSIDGNKIGYNPDGTLNRVIHANGVTDWVLPDLNAMPRPCQIAVTAPATALTANAAAPCGYDVPFDALWNSGPYSFDGAGNITAMGNWSYQYDAVNRLTSARNGTQGAETFAYDVFGNMTSHGGQAVPVSAVTNRLAASGTTYDAAGNLTALALPAAGATSQLHHVWDGVGTLRESYTTMSPPAGVYLPFVRGWDHYFLYDAGDERVATVTARAGDAMALWPPPPPGAALPYVRITYTLRGFGNEVLRTVVDDLDFTNGTYGVAVQGSAIPRYSLAADYVWRGPGQLLQVVRPDASNGTTYTRHEHLDHLGSPQATTDGAGRLFDQLSFSPFGAGGLLDDAPQFAGMERDGLAPKITDYDHARYYDPYGGRFLSVDPHSGHPKWPQSWNRYAYARGNPLILIDTDGRDVDVAPGLRSAYFWGMVRSPSLLLQHITMSRNHNVMWHIRSAEKNAGPGSLATSKFKNYKLQNGRIVGFEQTSYIPPGGNRTVASLIGHEGAHGEELLKTGMTLEQRFNLGDPTVQKTTVSGDYNNSYESDFAKDFQKAVSSEIDNYKSADSGLKRSDIVVLNALETEPWIFADAFGTQIEVTHTVSPP